MLTRNDIEGAVRALQAGVRDGTWSADDAKVYLKLQDDPARLSARWKKLADADPEIGAYLERLSTYRGSGTELLRLIARSGPTEDAYSPNDLDELHALHQEFGSTDDE